MGTRKESLVSIASAESDRRAKNKKFIPITPSSENDSEKRKQFLKKIGIIILSTMLVVLGFGSGFYFYGKSATDAVSTKQQIPSVIFTDDEKELEITNLSSRQILNELNAIKDRTNITVGRVRNIFITESFIDEEGLSKRTLVGAGNFLNAIDAQISTSFLRSLAPEFMVGVHVFDGNQPFIILRTSFYENAFAGMLGWERNIKEDLFPLFEPAEINVALTATTTSIQAVAPRTFSDLVIKNKDTRAIRNENGKIILLYSFIDKNTIIITTNENTFSEVFTRLTSSRTLQ